MYTKQQPDAMQSNVSDLDAFKEWAEQHLGQGYSLDSEEGVFIDKVTRWCFNGFRAGRRLAADHPEAGNAAQDARDATLTSEQVSKAARYLSDFSSAQCGVDKDDAWKIYGNDEIDVLRDALAAAGIKTTP